MTVPKACLDCTDLYHGSSKLRNGELYEVQAGVTLANLQSFIEFACGHEEVLREDNAVCLKKLADEFKFRRLSQAVDKMVPSKNGIEFDVLFSKISRLESKQRESDRIIRALKDEIQQLRHTIGDHLVSQKQTNRYVHLSLERIDDTIECVPELDMRTLSAQLRLQEMENYFVNQHKNLRDELITKHEVAIDKLREAMKQEDEKRLTELSNDLITQNKTAMGSLISEFKNSLRAEANAQLEDKWAVTALEKATTDIGKVRNFLDATAPCLVSIPRPPLELAVIDCRDTGIIRYLSENNRPVAVSSNAGGGRRIYDVLRIDTDEFYISNEVYKPFFEITCPGVFVVTRYRLKSYYPNPKRRLERTVYMKSWKLMPLNQSRVRQDPIDVQRDTDCLCGRGKIQDFVVSPHQPCHGIVLQMTDVNHGGTWQMALCGIELYGWYFQ